MTTTPLKLTAIGNSTGVILPKEILNRLKLEKGDSLYLGVEHQTITLSPCDPDFTADMEKVDEIMKEDRDVLHKLAQ